MVSFLQSRTKTLSFPPPPRALDPQGSPRHRLSVALSRTSTSWICDVSRWPCYSCHHEAIPLPYFSLRFLSNTVGLHLLRVQFSGCPSCSWYCVLSAALCWSVRAWRTEWGSCWFLPHSCSLGVRQTRVIVEGEMQHCWSTFHHKKTTKHRRAFTDDLLDWISLTWQSHGQTELII